MKQLCTRGLIFFGVFLFLGGVFPTNSQAQMTAKTEGKQVSLTMEEAISKAKQVHPGQVLDAELEHEGSMVWYEIEISGTDGMTHEVAINAQTGEVGPGELQEGDDKERGQDKDDDKDDDDKDDDDKGDKDD